MGSPSLKIRYSDSKRKKAQWCDFVDFLNSKTRDTPKIFYNYLMHTLNRKDASCGPLISGPPIKDVQRVNPRYSFHWSDTGSKYLRVKIKHAIYKVQKDFHSLELFKQGDMGNTFSQLFAGLGLGNKGLT